MEKWQEPNNKSKNKKNNNDNTNSRRLSPEWGKEEELTLCRHFLRHNATAPWPFFASSQYFAPWAFSLKFITIFKSDPRLLFTSFEPFFTQKRADGHLKWVQANVLSPFLKIVTICWWTLEQNPLRGNTNMIIMSLEVEGGGFLEGKQWRDDCAFTSVQVRSTSNDVFFSWTAHFQNWCQCSSDKVLLGSLLMIYLYSFMPSNGSTKYYDVNFSTKKTFHELLNRSCKDFSYAGNLKWVILNLYKYIWSFLFGVVCLYFDGLYIYLPDSCRVMSDWVVDLK